MKSLLYFNTDSSDFNNLMVKVYRDDWKERVKSMITDLMNKPDMFLCAFGFGGLDDLKIWTHADREPNPESNDAAVNNVIDRVLRGWCYHVIIINGRPGFTGQITHSFTIDEHE